MSFTQRFRTPLRCPPIDNESREQYDLRNHIASDLYAACEGVGFNRGPQALGINFNLRCRNERCGATFCVTIWQGQVINVDIID